LAQTDCHAAVAACNNGLASGFSPLAIFFFIVLKDLRNHLYQTKNRHAIAFAGNYVAAG